MKKKEIIVDTLLNIIASAVPIIILQIIIFPVLGARIGDVNYGLVITLISFSTLLSFPFGNVLNNIRLLTHSDYQKANIVGDFNILLISSIIINSIAIIAGTVYYQGDFSFVNVLLMVVLSSLNLVREYLIVSFRIALNYRSILINNLILCGGYLIGLFLFNVTGYWHMVYIMGSGLSLLYIIINSNLLTEQFVKTQYFKKTSYKSLVLLGSAFMGTALTYGDKLLMYPLLGPSAVSVYYSATLVGKIISMTITPLNGVMLSYLVKMEKVSAKNFLKLLILSISVGIIGYIFAIIFSRPILNFLYPDWVEESIKLIYITTATAIIGVIKSVINPIILRFFNVNWQILMGGSNLIIYTACAIIFYNLYGLIGFTLGILLSEILMLIFMIYIFLITLFKKKTDDKEILVR